MIIKGMFWIHPNTSIRKKQQLIRDTQEYWSRQEKKRIKNVAETFGISQAAAKKYVSMNEEEINGLG